MGCHSPQKEKNPPPNIILIIADDMAWDDSGAYGHPSIRTPNIDRLAREGMRFDRAFLTTSSCSPSRSSIITGKYPHQTGAQELHLPLPGDQVTFVEKLKAAGYWTASAGKWHLGEAT
ncbi:MAG: sulfatase-like hydrolase/transferase, partial [Bacteroidetes bacterium]|nr:sulfatase-like hydrolase/transferase [Bacteroidota bacterium]